MYDIEIPSSSCYVVLLHIFGVCVDWCGQSLYWKGYILQYLQYYFTISNFRRVLNVVCFLLGNSSASEFYMPTFRNTLFHLHRRTGMKDDEVWAQAIFEPNLSRMNTPTFSNPAILHTYPRMKMEQSVPKRRHIKFRRRGITQMKA